jgi:L-ascorbate metabolism protein UlaG (beta-lactamase superfamily)
VTATPCRHRPPSSHAIVGDVVGFALQWDGQSDGALWSSGDTVLHDGVRQVTDRFDIGVAILTSAVPRFTVTGPVRYTMTARDAIELRQQICPNAIVPVHYEGWSHFRDGRDAIEAELERAPADIANTFQLLPLGTPTSLSR